MLNVLHQGGQLAGVGRAGVRIVADAPFPVAGTRGKHRKPRRRKGSGEEFVNVTI